MPKNISKLTIPLINVVHSDRTSVAGDSSEITAGRRSHWRLCSTPHAKSVAALVRNSRLCQPHPILVHIRPMTLYRLPDFITSSTEMLYQQDLAK